MLSRGGASAGVVGSANALWNDNLGRPSAALSWHLISSTSSGRMAEKYTQRWLGLNRTDAVSPTRSE